MSNRNSLNINSTTNSNNSLVKNVPTLENYCLDVLLSKFDLFDIEKEFQQFNIKEKLLQRMLKLYQSKFTIKNQPQPQATLQRVEQLINYETTSNLDFSSINMNKYNNKNTFQFLSKCKSITSFTMSGFSSITSEKVLPLLEIIGHSLHKLDLSRCPRLNDTIIHYISLLCPNLEYLNLEDCIGISGAVFQRAYDIKNKNNMLIHQQQKSVNNNNNNNNNNQNHNNSNNNNNNTQQANLNSNNQVFMNKMSSLIELNLSGCKSINPKNLYSLKSAFPSLKMFSFGKNFLSDDDGAILCQTLPSSLVSLDLSFNPIGRVTLLALVPGSKNFTSFHLKSLSLGYCRCINAFDLSAVLAGLYKHLEYLSIPGCFQIDKSFLDQILLSPSSILSNLASASASHSNTNATTLSNQTAPSPSSVPTLSTSNNSNKRKSTSIVALKTLDISYCSQFLSSSTLVKLNQSCKQMKILRYNTAGFNHSHIYSIINN